MCSGVWCDFFLFLFFYEFESGAIATRDCQTSIQVSTHVTRWGARENVKVLKNRTTQNNCLEWNVVLESHKYFHCTTRRDWIRGYKSKRNNWICSKLLKLIFRLFTLAAYSEIHEQLNSFDFFPSTRDSRLVLVDGKRKSHHFIRLRSLCSLQCVKLAHSLTELLFSLRPTTWSPRQCRLYQFNPFCLGWITLCMWNGLEDSQHSFVTSYRVCHQTWKKKIQKIPTIWLYITFNMFHERRAREWEEFRLLRRTKKLKFFILNFFVHERKSRALKIERMRVEERLNEIHVVLCSTTSKERRREQLRTT